MLGLFLGMGLTSTSSFAQAGAPSTGGAAQAGELVWNVATCETIAASDPSLELVSQLCKFALSYRYLLPDFIVQQKMTSEGSFSKTVITAQVTFEKGLEHYSHVAIDGRSAPVSSITENLPNSLGFSSTGEFGPALANLFQVPGATQFKFLKFFSLRGIPVAIYSFNVPAEKNSFWTIRFPDGRKLRPGFRGQVWLEKQTGYLLREEMEPVNLPPGTDMTSAKTAIDYAMTPVGDAGTFLLPVKSESTVCNLGMLGMGACTTNTLVFHNYRKFGATTRVLTDSQP